MPNEIKRREVRADGVYDVTYEESAAVKDVGRSNSRTWIEEILLDVIPGSVQRKSVVTLIINKLATEGYLLTDAERAYIQSNPIP